MRPARYGGIALLAAAGLALGYASTAASSGGVTTTAPQPPTTTIATTTTAAAPTTTTAATTTAPAPPATPVAPRDLDRGCLTVAAALLWLPGHPLPLVVGPAVHAPWAKRPAQTTISYPAGGAVISTLGAELSAPTCAGGATLESLSLFDGAVTADSVLLRVDRDGIDDASVVAGLRVDGALVATPAPGTKLPLGDWGYLEVLRSNDVDVPHPGAPDVARLRTAGLVVHVTRRRDGVPAGADVQIAVADLAAPPPAPAKTTTTTTTTTAATKPAASGPPSAHRTSAARPARTTPRPRRPTHMKGKPHPSPPTHEPLTVTPRLGQKHFVFPVAGDDASYSDTYGGLRTDVSGGWHHGDDIFAPLGTPVVAVASGTLNRVGWERLGGWRLWVRDRNGDEFYYAHMSGYTPLALRSKTVHAGEVLGFVGNSGDAYPSTPPHLHFEIHPRTLLRLQYDGAVDPTTYLEQWHHVAHLRAPHPVLPGITALPSAEVKQEARFMFRELLSDRGLARPAARARPKAPPVRKTRADRTRKRAMPDLHAAAAATVRMPGGGFDPTALALVSLAAAALAGAGVLRLRHLRSRRRFRDWLASIPGDRHTEAP